MSEQYYVQEDQVQETPEVAVENWQAHANSLAMVVPEVATALNQAGDALGQLYDQAQTAGNTGAMALISATWERTQMIANQTVQMDALKQSAAAAIQTINEDRLKVIEQLGELQDAIADGDESYPELRDFADNIRSDEAEYQQEYVMPEIEQGLYEQAVDSAYDNISENLKVISGVKDWRLINRFIGILQGDFDATPLQSAQLKAFIESLSEES